MNHSADTGTDDPNIVSIITGRPDLRPTRHIVIDRPTKGEWWLLAAGASVALWAVVILAILALS